MTPQDTLQAGPTAFDYLVANPPYTRARDIPAADRQTLNETVSDINETDIPTTSPLHAYFLYHSQTMLNPGGQAMLLVPSETLETNYGVTVKQFLLDHTDLKTLVLFDRSESLFDDAVTTSVLLHFERLPPDEPPTDSTQLVYVEDFETACEVDWAGILTEADVCEWGSIRTLDQSAFDATDNWTNYVTPTTVDTTGLVPLSDVAVVSRGILTGNNAFFCLSKTDIESWGIPSRYLAPVVRGTRTAPGYEFTEADWQRQYEQDRPVSLLYHTKALADVEALKPGPSDNERGADEHRTDTDRQSGVVEYLRQGLVEDTVHEGTVVGNRQPWFVVDRRDPPPVLATYMTKGRHRFIRNTAAVRHLTNFLGIYPASDLSSTDRAALLAYLNSSLARTLIQRRGRTHGDGLIKIEPGELGDLPVIDPRALSSTTRDTFATAFEGLCQAGRDGGDTEAAIEAIDTILREQLGRSWPDPHHNGP